MWLQTYRKMRGKSEKLIFMLVFKVGGWYWRAGGLFSIIPRRTSEGSKVPTISLG